ncbi:PTPLA-domain-containing protein [Microthyrium microscopicum]|uniref:Very-long-chain (3R)-3-hydroxyacyl-CoA dehydratase n=1 Tax=Microthyrium microscopicum TaxID=703497 RepID=A0A6A6U2P5_9PEZI|nr:PTPLA-domain-containing protein [Microthyrium microscopicum]
MSAHQTTSEKLAATATREPAPLTPKTKYLISYNLISAGLWIALLHRVISESLLKGHPHQLYDITGTYARWVQTVALLEVGHSLFGIVRAPLFTTGLQVLSRVVLIWGIVENFPVEREVAYSTMLFAWSVTEVVRYSYFVLSLTGSVPDGLVWLRYNLFFVLYPLGIGSEVWLVFKSIPAASKQNPLLGYALMAIMGIYVPGSYVLYTHMMAQRRRVMRGKQRAKE